MPKISEADETLTRATEAVAQVKLDVIKAASNQVIETFIATIRECHELYEPDMESWIEDYQRRMREEEAG
jgi:hypothetical protein